MLKPATKDVRARAQVALTESPIHSHRDVRVERDGETIVLVGLVDTFYHKQLAQELVRAIADDCHCDVDNQIDVRYEAPVLRPR